MKGFITEEFPLLEKKTYLNTAYVGLLSKSLMEERQKTDESYFKKGDQFKVEAYESLLENQEVVAKFINANSGNTYLTPNFSSGIRSILNEIPREKRFLILEDDYPSLTSAIAEAGFQTVKIPIERNLEQHIEEKLDEESFDVLALSIVQYVSGLLIDFECLKRLKEKHPKLVIIGDATQMVGAMEYDFKNSPFDVIAASGYKWMLGGFGNGFICFSDYFLTTMDANPQEIYNKVYAGHFNMLGTASLVFAIQLMYRWDFSALMNYKKQLTNFLREELSDSNLLDPLIASRKVHSSIFNFRGDEVLFEKMKKEGIRASLRGEGIRVSVHFYNTETDIEKLIAFLKKNS